MTKRKPRQPTSLTVERLVEVLREHAVYGDGYIDEEDASNVIIDGHYNLQAVVNGLNGEAPKTP